MKLSLAALAAIPLFLAWPPPPAGSRPQASASQPATPSRPPSAWRALDRFLAHLKAANSPRTCLLLTRAQAWHERPRRDAAERMHLSCELACSPRDEVETRACYDALFERLRAEPALLALRKPELRSPANGEEWKVDDIVLELSPEFDGERAENFPSSHALDAESLVRACASRESIEIALRVVSVAERRVDDGPWMETQLDLATDGRVGLALGRVRQFLAEIESENPAARVVRLHVNSSDLEHQAWSVSAQISQVRAPTQARPR